MADHYPRLRIPILRGHFIVREVLKFTFFMHRSHATLSQGVHRVLEHYLRSAGRDSLAYHPDMNGEWELLDPEGWALIRAKLQNPRHSRITLTGPADNPSTYNFEYFGRCLDTPSVVNEPGSVSMVSFWLPTEYLEEHGPERVRELALEFASFLPFCSGSVGLAVNIGSSVTGMDEEVRKRYFRHPGLMTPNPGWVSFHVGTQMTGPSWLTFIGQPVLGDLGGVSELRAQLHHPGTTVEALEGDRALVTLGPWPEAGDLEQGHVLPAYRELARVLEPWLYHEPKLHVSSDMRDIRRWERRFLD
jgi:hypothetical protein